MSILGLDGPVSKQSKRGRPRGSKNRVKGPLLPVELTQDEINALVDLAVAYPMEEASHEEAAAFRSAMAKLKRLRS
jgi:hypothetical protein